MELMSGFVFLYEHIEIFIGVLITLILFVGIVFLWRMINEKPQAKLQSLDLGALEESLKRIMSQGQMVSAGGVVLSADGKPVEGAVAAAGAVAAGGAGAVAAGPVDAVAVAKLQNLLAEREKAIAEMQTALNEAKKGGNTAATGEHAMALLEMQNKVRDLEARLAEYSIIEDDIADLSMYKEENVRLKRELAEAQKGGGAPAASPAPQAAQVATEPARAPEPKAAAPAEADVLDQFAAAVKEHSVPKVDADTSVALDLGSESDDPLAGSLDTSKMLEEVSTLKSEDDEEDVLAGALDTDKLMNELGSFGGGAAPSAPAASGGADRAPEEDLFGEFKDEEKA